ncbi:hypothetical protein SH139x_005068 [Planctomycetaceae bacterium SH139]
MKICCAKPLLTGLVLGVTVTAATLLGFLLGRQSTAEQISLAHPFAELDATSGVSGEQFSMATGPISADADGIFVLDHASGLLQCNVLYPRAGQFGAAFQCNVKEALPSVGKNSKYLMVIGAAQFPGASNRGGFANCVVYVLDESTGAYACYSIPFNRSMVNSGAPQMGVMLPVARGQARVALDRDALR